jgi:hypothetical protein
MLRISSSAARAPTSGNCQALRTTAMSAVQFVLLDATRISEPFGVRGQDLTRIACAVDRPVTIPELRRVSCSALRKPRYRSGCPRRATWHLERERHETRLE